MTHPKTIVKPLKEIWDGLRLSSQKFAHYIPLYERHFAHLRESSRNVLEIGVLGGGSLEMWHAYFPNAKITGCDIAEDTALLTTRHPELDRLRIVVGDIWTWETLKVLASTNWDVIVDDGPHYTRQQILTADALLPVLNRPGIYWCEDLFPEQRRCLSTAIPGGRYAVGGYARSLVGRTFTNWACRQAVRSDIENRISGVHIYDGVTVIEKLETVPYRVAYSGTADGRFA
jgi:hypothetical protein